MKIYKNLGGNSGISGFLSGTEFIEVLFDDGSCYEYNHVYPGKNNVEQMKSLAVRGYGLNGFINRHVRKNYARKLA